MDQSILQQLSDNFLIIKKPVGDNLKIQLKDLYINQSIQLVLENMTDAIITSSMISRIRGEEIFTGEPVYTETVSIEIDEEEGTSEEVISKDFGSDLSHGITITTQEADTKGQYSAQVIIQMDSVYAYQIYEDPNYYFIDMKKPSEVYDKILVIDAGHGGKDAGAISKGGKFYEKDINLDILLHLKELLDKENIKVYYTRTADDKVFLRPRVNLANSVDCDYFISIHCNANVVTSPNGTEILYYDNEFKGVNAFHLAKLFSDEIAMTVNLKQKGAVKKQMEDIFIMDKSLVPMILIEVGYLTNNSDMNYLSKSENRKVVAQGIYNGIMRAYNELPVTE
jgi:N-acetylmuramoyl-L-alanine amidase